LPFGKSRLYEELVIARISVDDARRCGSAQAQTPARKKLLFIGEVKGFEHDSVSHAMATIEKLGQQSGLWDTYLRTDSELLTKQKLGTMPRT
jgi:hypothetical protein